MKKTVRAHKTATIPRAKIQSQKPPKALKLAEKPIVEHYALSLFSLSLDSDIAKIAISHDQMQALLRLCKSQGKMLNDLLHDAIKALLHDSPGSPAESPAKPSVPDDCGNGYMSLILFDNEERLGLEQIPVSLEQFAAIHTAGRLHGTLKDVLAVALESMIALNRPRDPELDLQLAVKKSSAFTQLLSGSMQHINTAESGCGRHADFYEGLEWLCYLVHNDLADAQTAMAAELFKAQKALRDRPAAPVAVNGGVQ